MNKQIYIKSVNKSTLETFSKHIFEEFNIKNFSIRESDFYVCGEYYSTSILGVKITVAIADEENLSDYNYVIIIEYRDYTNTNKSFLEQLADFIAKELLNKDYEIAIPETVREDSKIHLYSSKFKDSPRIVDKV